MSRRRHRRHRSGHSSASFGVLGGLLSSSKSWLPVARRPSHAPPAAERLLQRDDVGEELALRRRPAPGAPSSEALRVEDVEVAREPRSYSFVASATARSAARDGLALAVADLAVRRDPGDRVGDLAERPEDRLEVDGRRLVGGGLGLDDARSRSARPRRSEVDAGPIDQSWEWAFASVPAFEARIAELTDDRDLGEELGDRGADPRVGGADVLLGRAHVGAPLEESRREPDRDHRRQVEGRRRPSREARRRACVRGAPRAGARRRRGAARPRARARASSRARPRRA